MNHIIVTAFHSNVLTYTIYIYIKSIITSTDIEKNGCQNILQYVDRSYTVVDVYCWW